MSSRRKASLFEKATNGDPEAFTQLIAEDAASLSGLVRREVPDVSEWEDVFQETLVLAWRSIHQLQDVTRLRAWLLQIGRNHCRDYRKSSQRRQLPMDESQMEEHLNRFGQSVPSLRGSTGNAAEMLALLPETARELLDLFYLKGLTIAEIATRQRLPSGTVKSKLHKARGMARRILKGHCQ